jgi:hypothetical protein
VGHHGHSSLELFDFIGFLMDRPNIVHIIRKKGGKANIMPSLQKLIGEWNIKTFPEATPDSIIAHLKKEIEELSVNHDPEEAADCMILLLSHAHRTGYDLFDEVLQKHCINIDRTWGQPDKDGVIEHIK